MTYSHVPPGTIYNRAYLGINTRTMDVESLMLRQRNELSLVRMLVLDREPAARTAAALGRLAAVTEELQLRHAQRPLF